MTGQTGMRGESTGMKSKTIALVGAIGVLAISTALLGMAPADPVPAAPELPEPKPEGSVTSVNREALTPPQAGVRPPAPVKADRRRVGTGQRESVRGDIEGRGT